MSPLVSPPNRGYSDWQRIGNYDLDPFLDTQTGNRNTTFQSSITNVSRYACVAGLVGPVAGQCLATFEWYADVGGLHALGFRQFTIFTGGPGSAIVHMVNLGPYFQVFTDPLAGGVYNASLRLLATNRTTPLEFTPHEPVLVDQQAVAIVANGTATVYPSDYYAGPARLMFQMSSGAGSWNLLYLSTAGTWDVIDAGQVSNTNNTPFLIVPPIGAWRLAVFNNVAAAATYNLTVTPSTTGAT